MNETPSASPCDICFHPGPMVPHVEVSLSGILDARVFECSNCGFRQIQPRMSRKEIGMLYPDEYFDSGSEVGFKDYARLQQRYERDAYFLAKRLRNLSPKGRFLEVGCALGFLMNALGRACSWDLVGLDISRFATQFARREYDLDVHCGTLEEVGFADDSFDFILQKDLLEHVGLPRQHLLETSRILKPGGHLSLITPNGEANLRPLHDLAKNLNLSGSKDLPLLEQGHLSFFSRDHLVRLFEGCGFECVCIRNINLKRGLRGLYLGKKQKKLSAELNKERSPLRSSVPYFYFRHVMKTLDSLPAPFPLGNDFEFLLRKV